MSRARSVGFVVGIASHLNFYFPSSRPHIPSPAPAKHLVPTGDEV